MENSNREYNEALSCIKGAMLSRCEDNQQPLRIAVTGKMRSGKDTVSKILMDNIPNLENVKFSKGITEIINRYLPEMAANKNRELYQLIGQGMRKADPLVWVKYSFSKADKNKGMIITDLRQENEAEFLRDNGFIIIKVIADEDVRVSRMIASGDKFSLESLNHETEISIDAITPDYVVTNNDTQDHLESQVIDLINNITNDNEVI